MLPDLLSRNWRAPILCLAESLGIGRVIAEGYLVGPGAVCGPSTAIIYYYSVMRDQKHEQREFQRADYVSGDVTTRVSYRVLAFGPPGFNYYVE